MDDLKTLSDKQGITEAITDLFLATDRKDWPAVTGCFTAQVRFDMSSLGGPDTTLAAKDIAAAWEQGLAPLASVHHQAGNFRVFPRGDRAEATCYGIAIHHRPHPSGRNTRTFVGSYEFGLRREGGKWLVERFRFLAKFVDGNLELEK